MKEAFPAGTGFRRENQRHVHEYQGSVTVTADHNHRMAGITGEAIPVNNTHRHQLLGATDFCCTGHYHTFSVFTGPAIPVSHNEHIHFYSGNTTHNDGHDHRFRGSTLIGPGTGAVAPMAANPAKPPFPYDN